MSRSHVLTIVLPGDCYKRLKAASEETGRSIGDLAEAAVEEEALRWDQAREARRRSDMAARALKVRPVHPDWMSA